MQLTDKCMAVCLFVSYYLFILDIFNGLLQFYSFYGLNDALTGLAF